MPKEGQMRLLNFDQAPCKSSLKNPAAKDRHENIKSEIQQLTGITRYWQKPKRV